jgi:formylglycine-generating enzyme required for sulfatase activity
MRDLLHRARSLSGPLFLATAAALALHTQLAADTFGSGANQFDIDFVPIGNPGNAADTTGAPNPAGSVPYGYRMGTYEVSRDMITKANSAGSLGITMSDMSPLGGNGANRPATGVTWYEAASLVNWLNTSTGHQPAYNLSGASLSLWPSGDAWQAGGENLFRHKDAYYFLPSEQEWYKAAYYDGVAGVYYNYPTGSDSAPTAVAGGTGAGTAVYNQPFAQGPADIGNAGGLSPYRTMGQGGNVFEWMESAWDGVNDSTSEVRGLRGGYWDNVAVHVLSSLNRTAYTDPTAEGANLGFRVAAVPEPLESAGVIGVAALGFALWRRRRSL